MKADGEHRERWFETVERVVNGTFSMQKEWLLSQRLEWDEERAQGLAQEMYRRIFEMKFLPPGRGLWAMGSTLTEERKLYAALNNCGFVSTQDMANDPAGPFAFLMDASMLGVGVGFDTLGAGRVTVWGPNRKEEVRKGWVIEDSREGWVESVRRLIEAYFLNLPLPKFDYSRIRPAGMPIRGFGGVSQGGEILRELHGEIEEVLSPLVGERVSVTAIVDIMNLIGKCVVAGNVRRTAEIAFGSPEDEEYIDLKNYEKNPQRSGYGWTSNNSVFASVGMGYEGVCERVRRNGEPGFAWLENMRAYGRMGSPPDWKDARAMGGNPCLEQTLGTFWYFFVVFRGRGRGLCMCACVIGEYEGSWKGGEPAGLENVNATRFRPFHSLVVEHDGACSWKVRIDEEGGREGGRRGGRRPSFKVYAHIHLLFGSSFLSRGHTFFGLHLYSLPSSLPPSLQNRPSRDHFQTSTTLFPNPPSLPLSLPPTHTNTQNPSSSAASSRPFPISTTP